MIFHISSLTNWWSRSWRQDMDDLMCDLGLSYLGEGRSRRAYLSANERYVLKIPTSDYGITCNWNEAGKYKNALLYPCVDDTQYAPCRLIQNHVLMMWYCTDRMSYGQPDLPWWANYIDCCQVGRLTNGKIVAYDFG